ncbi:MAG: PEP-CTERM system TPR-repeat protein PrsT [Azoarcus sp.]|nr:PEP-CTERM system TPR-repeat protein PrsT [Azoarcus sp.]
MAFDVRRAGRAAIALFATLVVACSNSPEDMIASAKGFIEKRDLNAAAIQLKNALQENNQLAEGRFLLGSVYFRQENFSGASKELRRAFEMGYAKDEVVPLLMQSLLREGEYDRVLRDFADVNLDSAAAKAKVQVTRGDAFLVRRKFDDARRAYTAALAVDPDSNAAGIGLARIKLNRNDTAGALADAEKIATRAPDDAAAQRLLADARLASGDKEAAAKALADAVKADPNSINTHLSRVMVLQALKDIDGVRQEADAMKAVAPEHPAVGYVEAYLAFHDGRLDDARAKAVDAASKAQNFLPAQMLAGLVLLQKKEFALAQSFLSRALEAAPKNHAARMLMVSALLGGGQADRARDTLQPLLALGDKMTPEQLGLAGQVYMAVGDKTRAADFIKRAAAAAPDDSRAQTQLGIARMMSGDVDGALAVLDAASQLDPNAIQADLARIAIHLRHRELDKALEIAAEIEKKKPDEPQTWGLKGRLLTLKGDRAGARAAYGKALALDPAFLSAIVDLAQLDLADKKPDQARQRFKRLVGDDAKSADALIAYAGVLQATGAKPGEIQPVLEHALRIATGRLTPSLVLTRFYLAQNDKAKASDLAQQTAAAWPDDPRALQLLGEVQLATGNAQQAAGTFAKLAGLAPRAAAPLTLLAAAQQANGDAKAAIASLQKAYKLERRAEQFVRLHAALTHAKRGDEARKLADEWLAAQPKDIAGRTYLAERALAAERYGEAQTLYRKINELLPDNATMLNNLAWVSFQLKDAQALAIAERAYKLEPENPAILDTLGTIQIAQGDAKAGLANQERAVKLAPDAPALRLNLAKSYAQLGRRDDAKRELNSLLSRAPAGSPLHNEASALLKSL